MAASGFDFQRSSMSGSWNPESARRWTATLLSACVALGLWAACPRAQADDGKITLKPILRKVEPQAAPVRLQPIAKLKANAVPVTSDAKTTPTLKMRPVAKKRDAKPISVVAAPSVTATVAAAPKPQATPQTSPAPATRVVASATTATTKGTRSGKPKPTLEMASAKPVTLKPAIKIEAKTDASIKPSSVKKAKAKVKTGEIEVAVAKPEETKTGARRRQTKPDITVTTASSRAFASSRPVQVATMPDHATELAIDAGKKTSRVSSAPVVTTPSSPAAASPVRPKPSSLRPSDALMALLASEPSIGMLSELQRYLAASPNQPGAGAAWARVGSISLKLGDEVAAQNAFDKAFGLASSASERGQAIAGQAMTANATGDYAKAGQMWTRLAQEDAKLADAPEALAARAVTATGQGDLRAADDLWKSLELAAPKTRDSARSVAWQAHAKLGAALTAEMEGNPTAAQTLYRQVTETFAAYPEAALASRRLKDLATPLTPELAAARDGMSVLAPPISQN